MSVTQTSYPDNIPITINGNIRYTNSRDIFPYVVESSAIPVGRACRQGTNANQAQLGIRTNEYVGVSIRERTYGPESSNLNGQLMYPVGKGVNVLIRGIVGVEVADAVMFRNNVTADYFSGQLSTKTASGYELTGGTSHGTLVQFQAISDGAFSIDGNDVSGIDLSSVTNLAGVATVVQAAIRALTTIDGYDTATVTYDTDHFESTFPEESPVLLFEDHSSGTGTDISTLLALDSTNGELDYPQILVPGARWMTSQTTQNELAEVYLDGSLPSS